MDKFIDRQRLEAHFSPAIMGKDAYTAGEVLLSIQMFPSADVQPVVHAHWIWEDVWTENSDFCTCSNCGENVIQYVTASQMDKQLWEGKAYWSYCPHCGAKMDDVVK